MPSEDHQDLEHIERIANERTLPAGDPSYLENMFNQLRASLGNGVDEDTFSLEELGRIIVGDCVVYRIMVLMGNGYALILTSIVGSARFSVGRERDPAARTTRVSAHAPRNSNGVYSRR